ncbi:MAG: efflux RND transporter periplasmic adaptor subunit [Planctomycetota bacterium]
MNENQNSLKFLSSVLAIIVGVSATLTAAVATADNEAGNHVEAPSDKDVLGLTDGMMSTFLQGIAKPRKNAVLRFSSPGIVSGVHVQDGDSVQRGDALLTTDDRLEQASVKMAEIDTQASATLAKSKLDLELAQSKYQRLKTAHQRGASSENELIEKLHALELAELTYRQQVEEHKRLEVQLEIAKVNLSNKTLTAPFDGQVIRVHHKLGNSVDFSTAAVICADLSLLTVEMNLPSRLYGKLKVGAIRKLYAAMPVEKELDAKITYISNEIEPSSRTFRVTFEIENHDLRLPSGFECWFVRPQNAEFSVQSVQLN